MAEKRTIELEVKESGFKSLRTQLREAQLEVAALSDKFGVTSKEATDAAKAAGILKDKIADAKDLTDAFNPDAKFNSLSASIGGVLNGFQAYEGAMGLIGVESEDLQETLLKVQSAMALSQGIQGALEAKDSFVALGAVVKTAFTGMTAASKAFMVGGIGLLITAIGLLVANWDNLTASSNKAAEEQKKLAAQTKAVAEAAKEQRKAVAEESSEFVGLIYQLKATNANSKERANLMKEINSKYGTTLKNLSDENEFQAQLNKSVNEYIELQRVKFKIQKNEDLIQRALEKEIALEEKLKKSRLELFRAEVSMNAEKEKFVGQDVSLNENNAYISSFNRLKKEVNNTETELSKLGNRLVNYGLNINNLKNSQNDLTQGGKVYVEQVEKETKAIEKQTEAVVDLTKQSEEEALKIKQKAADDWLDTIEKIQEENYLNTLTEKDKDIQLVEDKYFELESLALGNAEQEVIIAEAKKNELLDIDKKYAVASVELTKLTRDQKIEAATAVANTFSQLSNLLGEQTAAGKAAAIAAATIETFLSAQKAYSATVGIPIVGPILAPINAGIAIAAGIKNIKAITSVKTPNGGGGGAGNMPTAPSGGGGVSAPNFNIVGNSGINQLAELGGQPIQAYVVSGEVTSAQALDRNRIQNATF